MLLEPLVSTIQTIKDRIATHGPILRQNETRTRAALIDPLLNSLGWDVSDPALVTPEYRTGGWADYALIGAGNRPAAIIEAKRLGSVVENHLEQAVGYCIQEGIAYAGVTDGNHWQLYRTFEPVPLAEKLVLDVSIASAPAHEAALKLLLVWRPNLATGQPVGASIPAFLSMLGEDLSVSSDTSIPGYTANRSPSLAIPATSAIIPSNEIEPGWRPLSEVIPKTGDAPPVRLRLADGSERGMRRAWAALVESTVEWLWRNNLLDLDKVPIQSSKWRNIVNTQPLHPEGKEFKQPTQIEGTPLWVERNISGQVAAANSKRLLEICGVDQDTVFVWFE